eukprot:CCRYP_002477-RA/>CCRYP_002477-RA protein AED:0.39 eAED:0.39 QI:0/0/0/1/0/0/2/0/255
MLTDSMWAEPTKNKTEGELILAYNRALHRMKACGIYPARQVLDNKISAAYKMAITDSCMTYQLFHLTTSSKYCGESHTNLEGSFHCRHQWHRQQLSPPPLVPTAATNGAQTLQSNVYPHISSRAHLYGHHDYNTHPFVPRGTEALIHDKHHCRKTFAQHCTKGLVISTSYKHYRCWKVWTYSSCTTHISATNIFKHKYITNPSVTPADAIIAAAANLSHLLTKNLAAQHNNNLQQTDLTRLQILTQPPPLPSQWE